MVTKSVAYCGLLSRSPFFLALKHPPPSFFWCSWWVLSTLRGTEPLCALSTMGKRERGVAAQDSGDKAKNKKRQTQQNGSARLKPHSTPTTTTDNSSNTAEAAGAGEEAVAMDPALSKGKGKGGGDKMTALGQKEEGHKEGNDGGGGAGGSSNRKRKKREHEEEGYEGPVEEEDSGSDDSAQGVAMLSFVLGVLPGLRPCLRARGHSKRATGQGSVARILCR